MLVIASRGSQLALWQANWVERQLAARADPARGRFRTLLLTSLNN